MKTEILLRSPKKEEVSKLFDIKKEVTPLIEDNNPVKSPKIESSKLFEIKKQVTSKIEDNGEESKKSNVKLGVKKQIANRDEPNRPKRPMLGERKQTRKRVELKRPTRLGVTRRQITKRVLDPNKPKRPMSAFFVFMTGFREEYQAMHPDSRSSPTVGKIGVERWKSMSEVERAPFVATAERARLEYELAMDAYNNRGFADRDVKREI